MEPYRHLNRSIKGKTAIITGAASGMGRATAHLFAREGANVVVTDLDQSKVDIVVKEINDAGIDHVVGWALDVGSHEAVKDIVSRTAEKFGGIDIIVNNAGVTRYAQIMDLTEADWDRIHRVNAKGVFFCLQRAAREMIRQNQADGRGGRIINIASLSAVLPPLGQTNYAAAKAGVVALGQTLAKEVARAGITVNSLLPGFIEPTPTDVPQEMTSPG